ncbi:MULTISPECIES: 3'-5' exonuclease [Aerococcus]|uniref:DNA polymerase III polC-type n=3 Tax=Aerococcus TaxID=1375 RepID=A0A1E9PGS5_9LACT|nr:MULTISPECIES: 3'-5' exonuclease [Aerococcus]MBU5610976.1 3'-5' exonuclease [Aerococcus urinae]MCY3034029.1 3'-5' exonuclease [Aerococcus mictus]MCY3065797.1 3'-5' exonuclease [Aerococcus mictus]MCY3066447.1 3'-5' exonuclease [Aerococcus mictus]MCY3071372.1 3'-5' exonuclease [Aerococcus mictus]
MNKYKSQKIAYNDISYLIPNEYVVFDLETTGLDFSSKIIQLSAVHFRNGSEIDHFDHLINPKTKIPDIITEITGITESDVINEPTIDDVIDDFVTFIGDLTIAGYNSKKFDIQMLKANTDIDLSKHPQLDVLELARMSPIYLYNYKLTTIKAYYGIQNKAHDSLNDSRATALVLEKFRASEY